MNGDWPATGLTWEGCGGRYEARLPAGGGLTVIAQEDQGVIVGWGWWASLDGARSTGWAVRRADAMADAEAAARRSVK